MTATTRSTQPHPLLSIRGLFRSAVAITSRPARVSALLLCVVAMSMADLYMTLQYVMNFGMIEVNPLARRIIEAGSAAELIMFKLGSVLLAVGVLFLFRSRRTAELGAWACFVAMVWLTAHWFNYNAIISTLTTELQSLAALQEPGWVSMAPGE